MLQHATASIVIFVHFFSAFDISLNLLDALACRIAMSIAKKRTSFWLWTRCEMQRFGPKVAMEGMIRTYLKALECSGWKLSYMAIIAKRLPSIIFYHDIAMIVSFRVCMAHLNLADFPQKLFHASPM